MRICDVTIRRVVTLAARRGVLISYGELAEKAGGARHNRGDVTDVTRKLKRIAEEDLEAGRPVRTVNAVNARTRLPGPPILHQVRQHGRRVDESLAQFVANERARCMRHYG